MWFLIYIAFMNAALPQYDFVNVYRVTLGITQISIVEVTLAFGFIYALVRGGNITAQYPNTRTHPVLVIIQICLWLGFICGWIGAAMNSTDWGHSLRSAREYIAVPISILIGYRLLANPTWAFRMRYVYVFSAIGGATMLLIYFNDGAEQVRWGGSLNYVRTTQFICAIPALAALILLYSQVNRRMKMLPTVLALGIAGYCFLAACSPMHRSDWISLAMAYLTAIFLLPRAERISATLKTVMVMAVVGIVVLVGIELGSRATGRDYGKVVHDRIISLLPTERKGNEAKAWDTRVAGMFSEMAIWMRSPLFGEGFGYQNYATQEGKIANVSGYNHNGWISVLVISGIFGFVGWMMMIFSMIIIGARMARNPVDNSSLFVGFLSCTAGVYLLFMCLATLVFHARTGLFYGVLCGMMFRVRDWEGTTLALQQQQQQADETWLYEQGYYNEEGGWVIPENAPAIR